MLIAEAVAAGWRVTEQFVAPGGSPVMCESAVVHLAAGVLERVASTSTPQPLIAVVEARRAALPADASFVLVADRLGDPGNLGTVIRSAAAAGADAVVVTDGSVDPFNPKVVRASAGSLFRVPIVEPASADVFPALRGAGLTVIGTSSHHGSPYTRVDLTRRVAIVFGNEAHGMSADAAVDEWLSVPTSGGVESLNVAMAATVVSFEAARQRGANVAR